LPVADAGKALEKLGDTAGLLLNTNLLAGVRAPVQRSADRRQLNWSGMPFLTPWLAATNGPEGSFLHGGLFPKRPTDEPAPTELFAQLARPQLVYYDWEITQERLMQWRGLVQLWHILNLRATPGGSPVLKDWLDAIAPKLGNTVTELNVAGPRELSFVRKSHVGLTGFELAVLAQKLDEFLSAGRPKTAAPPALPVP
jgi:hypothetical protein